MAGVCTLLWVRLIPEIAAIFGISGKGNPGLNGSNCSKEHFSTSFRQPDIPALAVMLGANVGTTLIVQLLSLDLSSLTPALVLVGVLMFRRSQSSRTHDLGRVAIGLGLMLLALHQLLELVTPFEDAPSLRLLLGAVATQPLLDVVVAAGLTWAAHSSVAVVLLIMSLAAKGVVPPDQGLSVPRRAPIR